MIEAIFKSCKIKKEIVIKDEKEKSLRMILNFGHTFAHGFEGANNFSRNLNHGEAVLLGMFVASELSCIRKILSPKDLDLIRKHYSDLNLIKNIKKYFNKNKIKKIIYFMKKDKKNTNEKINLILLKKIGRTTKPKEISLSENEVKKFILSYF